MVLALVFCGLAVFVFVGGVVVDLAMHLGETDEQPVPRELQHYWLWGDDDYSTWNR